jgi:predicted RNA-binding Zn ribbon-like protein
MLGRALERGLASLVARWMLEGHADALLDRVAAAGALDAVEIASLREDTRKRLGKVQVDGALYADLLVDAVSAVFGSARGPIVETASSLRPIIDALLRTAVARARDRRDDDADVAQP